LHSHCHVIPRTADQKKIRTAISLRRVDPSDIPATARTPQQAAPSQKRRRAEFEASQAASSSQASSSASSKPQLAAEEEEEVEVIEAEQPDELYELYLSMPTDVVGVQYYKGMAGAGEQVRLTREPVSTHSKHYLR
jgi:SWI/SNF-related matrix-associated actin-dependent regulator of chromatin subfamily A3